jgi:PKD domain
MNIAGITQTVKRFKSPPSATEREDETPAESHKGRLTDKLVGGGPACWDFGDGSSTKGDSAIHTYASPGTYAVGGVDTDNGVERRDREGDRASGGGGGRDREGAQQRPSDW